MSAFTGDYFLALSYGALQEEGLISQTRGISWTLM